MPYEFDDTLATVLERDAIERLRAGLADADTLANPMERKPIGRGTRIADSDPMERVAATLRTLLAEQPVCGVDPSDITADGLESMANTMFARLCAQVADDTKPATLPGIVGAGVRAGVMKPQSSPIAGVDDALASWNAYQLRKGLDTSTDSPCTVLVDDKPVPLPYGTFWLSPTSDAALHLRRGAGWTDVSRAFWMMSTKKVGDYTRIDLGRRGTYYTPNAVKSGVSTPA